MDNGQWTMNCGHCRRAMDIGQRLIDYEQWIGQMTMYYCLSFRLQIFFMTTANFVFSA